MIDREKVINELEWIIDLFSNYERHAMGDEEMQSLNDAIVLLKAQDNDLISRAAAIDAIVSLTAFANEDDIKKFVEEKACDDYFLGGICDAIDEIKNIPAVDAAPVVRCRDCKHCNAAGCAPGFGWCERSGHNHGTTDDWFCADGEMKYD